MAQIVRQTMSSHDDARSLLRAVYSTEVDLVPDQKAKTLTVRLHPLANTWSDQALENQRRNQCHRDTIPGTELRLNLRIGVGAKCLKIHEIRRSEGSSAGA
jgi:uncharacterized protein (DUF2267 family)